MRSRKQGRHLHIELSALCADVSEGEGRDVPLEARIRFESGPFVFIKPCNFVNRCRRVLGQERYDATVIQRIIRRTVHNGLVKTWMVATIAPLPAFHRTPAHASRPLVALQRLTYSAVRADVGAQTGLREHGMFDVRDSTANI